MIPLHNKFKLRVVEVNPITIKKVSQKEVLNMHRRMHQLFGRSPNKKVIKKKHELIVKEMLKRDMKHSSPLEESVLYESSSTSRFVVHEHLAHKAGRHFDLRLEKDQVLKSWAVRHLDQLVDRTKKKVLAVQMPDHRLSYIDFQGEISDGYGAGKVNIWDNGTYELDKWDDKSIVVKFNGQKLKGRYALIKTVKDWLFLKVKEN